jgi:hypothetical protein
MSSNNPELIFIIPYRDRAEHKHFFQRQMKYLLEDYNKNSYEIYFVHQKDIRSFNRGAMKNIGFLAIRNKYPETYKNITFVFHDVDTLPYKKDLIDYKTTQGTIKHFYGYEFALGGIFSIKGCDFETIGGFPNFWAWGGEDNVIQKRVLRHNLIIDRNNFFKIGNRNILQFADGFIKTINRTELASVEKDDNYEYYNTISNLHYEFNNEFIDVHTFSTRTKYSQVKKTFEKHNITRGNNKIQLKKRKTSRNVVKGVQNLQKLVILS